MANFIKTPFFLLVMVFCTLFSPSIQLDTITPTQPLADGETLVSSGETYALGFFTPPNSTNRYLGIWFNKIPTQTVVWVANRRTPTTTPNCTLTITPDGILTIIGPTSIWSSDSTPITNPIAQLLDSGNFVVRRANSTDSDPFAWQSFDHPTDSLLPGMKLGWDLRTGLNRNLTAWESDSNPFPGSYTIALDVRDDPQLTLFSGDSTRKWQSGPWVGFGWSGIPQMAASNRLNGFIYQFASNPDEIFYTCSISDRSIFTRLLASRTGQSERWVWLERSNIWKLYAYNPHNPCDEFGACGPNAVCDPNSNPICGCLQGFKPNATKEWDLGVWTKGCVRRTGLNCGNASDVGFAKMSGVKLPDTVSVSVRSELSLNECKDECLRNCSCTGFSSKDFRGGGSGCRIWVAELVDLQQFVDGGQDLYVKVAASDLALPPRNSKSHKKGPRIVGVVTASIVSGLVLLVLICCYLSRKKQKAKRNVYGADFFNGESSGRHEELELPFFDIGSLKAATGNFSAEKMLGEGGFGSVYKGKLRGQEIAVKRLSKTSMQGVDEFKNEVMLIAKLQHRNLVRLLGYCIQEEERMLIYEYMANKSLDAFLFDQHRRASLDWKKRFHIIAGIARGLLYLHQDSRFRIIHRDLKASNILLDKDMNPKISDFGMARIFGEEETIAKTRRVVGTYGYMSPEYAMNGIFSVKSDVYSFGVLVLEIISGQKNKGVYLAEPRHYLLGNAWRLWNEGKWMELIDPLISSSIAANQVMRCMKVGLLCVQEWPLERPTMSSVTFMLDSQDAPIPEPKQPGFVARGGSSEPSSSSSRHEGCSVDDLVITTVSGR